jgi:hypothetical protein
MELQKAESEELGEDNESNQWCELRDLHLQLWKAKEATGAVTNLKHKHTQAND